MSHALEVSEAEVLTLHLLGGFRAAVGPRVIQDTDWKRRKARALVKVLALAQGHRLHREQVMDVLWPTLSPDPAANNFYQTLHAARRILTPSPELATRYLDFHTETLSLCPATPLWIDVSAFETAAAQARHSQAVATYAAALDLYGGDLLPEDIYADWTRDRRETLRQTYLTLLLDLSELYERAAQYDAAIETRRRVLTVDAAHEAAHVGLMRLYVWSGQRQLALRQYTTLQAALQRELGAEPEPDTQLLYQAIADGRFPPPSRPSSTLASVASMPPTADQQTSSETMTDAGQPWADVPHNLPAPLTRFIGRANEMSSVKHLLTTGRLVTLIGTGGCGKTRLAIEVASERQTTQAYPDGVWLVELAALTAPALVPTAVTTALGVRETSGQSLTETLLAYLKSRQLLLVLDNCEHVIDACAQLTHTLLRSCAQIRVLATSRESLNIPGELTWLVPPLALPPPSYVTSLTELADVEAVQLFIDRAQAIWPEFTLTQGNSAAVAEICLQLDGLPLAIELAAARVRVLAVEQIASRLADCFRLLGDGSRVALARHRTLRATLDWSHALLSAPERVLFRRLAVFVGGFTLEAAAAVFEPDAGESEGPGAADTLDVLSHLVGKSLVAVERQPDRETRYRLLEPIRQYSRQKLRDAGEAAIIIGYHRAWYLALAEAAEPQIQGQAPALWVARLGADQANLRAALAGCLKNDPAGGLRMALSLRWFWRFQGHFTEGQRWLDSMLAVAAEPKALRAKALLMVANFARWQDDLAVAWPRLEEALRLFRELDNPWGLSRTLNYLGYLAMFRGDYSQAEEWLAEGLTLARASGDREAVGWALGMLGNLAVMQSDFGRAKALLDEGEALWRRSGERMDIAWLLIYQGNLAKAQGHYDRAIALVEEALALSRAIDDRPGIAMTLRDLGSLALIQGDHHRATELLEKSLALFRDQGRTGRTALCLVSLAGVAAATAQPQRAARLLGAADSLLNAIGAAMWPDTRADYDGYLAAARGLDPAQFAVAYAAGQAMTSEQAIAYALTPETS